MDRRVGKIVLEVRVMEACHGAKRFLVYNRNLVESLALESSESEWPVRMLRLYIYIIYRYIIISVYICICRAGG